MNTIDSSVMAAAMYAIQGHSDVDIHTVTIMLNGQHGGADLTIEGTEGDEDVTRTVVLR